MKKTIFALLLVGFLASFFSNTALAQLSQVTVLEIVGRPDGSNQLVRFSQNFPTTCSDGGQYGIVALNNTEQRRHVWALLMLAYASGRKVTVATSGCSYHNVISEVTLLPN